MHVLFKLARLLLCNNTILLCYNIIISITIVMLVIIGGAVLSAKTFDFCYN